MNVIIYTVKPNVIFLLFSSSFADVSRQQVVRISDFLISSKVNFSPVHCWNHFLFLMIFSIKDSASPAFFSGSTLVPYALLRAEVYDSP